MAAEPITVGYTTAKTVTLAIRRDSDLAWFDFNDTTFKTSGWTTPEQSMTEQSGAGLPTGLVGVYRATVDPGAWSDGTYVAYVQDSLVTTKPVGFAKFWVKNGTIVADVLLDAAVTTRLAPTVAGRTLDVSAGGEAGVDWANVGSPTTAVNLSATNIDVDQVVASVSGAVGSVASGGITAASIAADAITAAKIADGAIDAATFAAGAITATAIAADAITDAKVASDVTIASVTGAVGSVTGNVGGNVAGSVASVTAVSAGAITSASFAAGAIDAAAIAPDAIGSAELAASAVTEIQSGLATAAALTTAQTAITAIQAKTDNLPSGVKKNTALDNFTFPMFDSADGRTPKTSLTVTAQRSLDGAALASCANAVTELSNGLYTIDLAAADLNGDVVVLRFTASGADPTLMTIVTEP